MKGAMKDSGKLDKEGKETLSHMLRAADEWGVTAMLDAYYSGIPAEDLVASSGVELLPWYM